MIKTEKLLKQLFEKIAPIYQTYGTNSQKNLCERFFKVEEKVTHKTSVALLQHMLENYTTASFKREDLIDGEMKITDEIFEMSDEDFAKKVNRAARKDKGTSAKKSTKNEQEQEYDKAKEQFRGMRITEALKILRCNRLIKKEGSQYSLNKILWSKGVVYRIKHYPTLANLSNLMFSYIKNEAYLGPNDFFKETDKLIGAVIKPSIKHNLLFQQELYIAKQIEDKGTVSIREGQFRVEVLPRSVEIGESGKYFTYEEAKSSKTGESSLSRVVLPNQ